MYDLKKDLITNDDYNFYFETYNNEMKKLLKELKKLKENEFTLSHDKRIPSCSEETISNKKWIIKSVKSILENQVYCGQDEYKKLLKLAKKIKRIHSRLMLCFYNM